MKRFKDYFFIVCLSLALCIAYLFALNNRYKNIERDTCFDSWTCGYRYNIPIRCVNNK